MKFFYTAFFLLVVQSVFAQAKLVVSPASKTIQPGQVYKAEIFVVGLGPKEKLKGITVNEAKLTLENGYGVYVEPSDSSITKTTKRQYVVKAIIKAKKKTYELVDTVRYTVAPVEMFVEYLTPGQVLYRDCGNQMRLYFPMFERVDELKFTVDGGRCYLRDGVLTILPNKAQITLKALLDDRVIAQRKFKTIPLPKPKVKLLTGKRGRPVDEKRGMPVSSIKKLSVAVIVDEYLRASFPSETRYTVSKWEVHLARGNKPVGRASFRRAEADLSSMMAKAQPGDRLIVEVQEVRRRTASGRTERVSIFPTFFTIPLY